MNRRTSCTHERKRRTVPLAMAVAMSASLGLVVTGGDSALAATPTIPAAPPTTTAAEYTIRPLPTLGDDGHINKVTASGIIGGEGAAPYENGIPTSGGHALRWDAQRRLIDLGVAPGADSTYTSDVTDTAQVGVSTWPSTPRTGWRWTAATGLRTLPVPQGYTDSVATRIDPRGRTLGTAYDPQYRRHLLRWSTDERVEDLGNVGGAGEIDVRGVSRDGLVLLTISVPDQDEIFRVLLWDGVHPTVELYRTRLGEAYPEAVLSDTATGRVRVDVQPQVAPGSGSAFSRYALPATLTLEPASYSEPALPPVPYGSQDSTVTPRRDGLPGRRAWVWSAAAGKRWLPTLGGGWDEVYGTTPDGGCYGISLASETGGSLPVIWEPIGANPVRVSVVASQDTYVNAKAPRTAYGNAGSLAVGGDPDYRTLLRFDPPPAPAGRTLIGARLTVRASTETFAGTTAWFTVGDTDLTRWSEQTTWTTQPDLGAHRLGALAALGRNARGAAWLDASHWTADAPIGLVLAAWEYNRQPKDSLWLRSSEYPVAADRPTLELIYR